MLLTQKTINSCHFGVCVCVFSLSLYLSISFSCVSHSWARLSRTTGPSLLCFAVAGAFSLQEGLQQYLSTSQSSSWSLHVSLGWGSAPNFSQPIYSSHLQPCLKQPPSALASLFWPQKFSFIESLRCLPQDFNQGPSRSSSSEGVFSLLIWGLRSRILAPSTCKHTYQQEPDDQEILFSSSFGLGSQEGQSRTTHLELPRGAFEIHESIW